MIRARDHYRDARENYFHDLKVKHWYYGMQRVAGLDAATILTGSPRSFA